MPTLRTSGMNASIVRTITAVAAIPDSSRWWAILNNAFNSFVMVFDVFAGVIVGLYRWQVTGRVS